MVHAWRKVCGSRGCQLRRGFEKSNLQRGGFCALVCKIILSLRSFCCSTPKIWTVNCFDPFCKLILRLFYRILLKVYERCSHKRTNTFQTRLDSASVLFLCVLDTLSALLVCEQTLMVGIRSLFSTVMVEWKCQQRGPANAQTSFLSSQPDFCCCWLVQVSPPSRNMSTNAVQGQNSRSSALVFQN